MMVRKSSNWQGVFARTEVLMRQINIALLLNIVVNNNSLCSLTRLPVCSSTLICRVCVGGMNVCGMNCVCPTSFISLDMSIFFSNMRM